MTSSAGITGLIRAGSPPRSRIASRIHVRIPSDGVRRPSYSRRRSTEGAEMAFEELKQRQSVMWGNGRFERISDTATEIYDSVVESIAPVAGERWLDLACGTGAIAERAAAAGAEVVGVDLAPALIETAEQVAAEKGLEIDYRVGDCENLQGIEDASFDVVSSTFGVMFAPDQSAAAGELARVARPGGRLGLACWTPEGGIGAMFKFTSEFHP